MNQMEGRHQEGKVEEDNSTALVSNSTSRKFELLLGLMGCTSSCTQQKP
jgi:hypothetical protein